MILFDLFWNFLLIGCFSFGGGYAMLPLIERQVTDQGWMTASEFSEVITISGMLPGSIGTNASVFVGYQTAGIPGAIVALTGMILPSFLIILLIGKFYREVFLNTFFMNGLQGLRPIIVSLIVYAAIRFALTLDVLQYLSWNTLVFFIMFIFSLYFLLIRKAHPLFVIILSAIIGVIVY